MSEVLRCHRADLGTNLAVLATTKALRYSHTSARVFRKTYRLACLRDLVSLSRGLVKSSDENKSVGPGQRVVATSTLPRGSQSRRSCCIRVPASLEHSRTRCKARQDLVHLQLQSPSKIKRHRLTTRETRANSRLIVLQPPGDLRTKRTGSANSTLARLRIVSVGKSSESGANPG